MIEVDEAKRLGLVAITAYHRPTYPVSGSGQAWIDWCAGLAVRLIHAGQHAELVHDNHSVAVFFDDKCGHYNGLRLQKNRWPRRVGRIFHTTATI